MKDRLAAGNAIGRVVPELKREPVSEEIVRICSNLTDRANLLAERVHGKLSPVMTSDFPKECDRTGMDSREYPPLFAELKGFFDSLERSLESIENAISRTEL